MVRYRLTQIQTRLNEIIYDSSTDAAPEPSKASLPASRPAFGKEPSSNPPAMDVFRKEDLPNPTDKIVVDTFPSTKIVDYGDNDDEESPPTTKGDIMGCSNEDNGDDDGGYSDDREQDERTEEKFVVPDTDEGLKDRFNHLFIKFTRETVRAWR